MAGPTAGVPPPAGLPAIAPLGAPVTTGGVPFSDRKPAPGGPPVLTVTEGSSSHSGGSGHGSMSDGSGFYT